MPSFSDRLAEAVRAKGPLCVGLDPRWESLPKAIRDTAEREDPECAAEAIQQFCVRVMELVQPFTGVVKPQAAFFELLGPLGLKAMQRLLQRAKETGFVTILDAKRG